MRERSMRALLATGTLVGLGLLAATGLAAPLDGTVPMLCALNSVVECTRRGDCERSTAEEAQVPPFVRIDVGKRLLSSVDGARATRPASGPRAPGPPPRAASRGRRAGSWCRACRTSGSGER